MILGEINLNYFLFLIVFHLRSVTQLWLMSPGLSQ
jgi:hypothetical protein